MVELNLKSTCEHLINNNQVRKPDLMIGISEVYFTLISFDQIDRMNSPVKSTV